MFWSKIKKTEGFTLTELIVVIGILGILAGATLIAINPIAQFQKGRDAKRKGYLNQIKTALEFFKIDVGRYPAAAEFPGTCGNTVQFVNPIATPPTVYINNMPCDPSGGIFTYTRISDTQYSLRACLENQYDPDADTTNTCGADRYSLTVYSP